MKTSEKIDEGREATLIAAEGAGALLLTTGVAACMVYLLLMLSSLLLVRSAGAQSAATTAGMQLEAGLEKEKVDGDLAAAMNIYQRLAANANAPREVRAKALLRLAVCKEKIGKEAKQVYQQIVSEYGDQPAASEARARLVKLAQKDHPTTPLTMSERKIEWSKLGSVGHTDTDGTQAVLRNGNSLYIGDVAGHSRRLILNNNHFGWVPSRDFAWVALDLLGNPERRHTLALIKTDGTGYHELIRDDESNSIFRENSSFQMCWSWDDRFLALSDFSLRTEIAGQLWVVSTKDGQRRIVADMPGQRVRKANFSPDGKYLAFVTMARDLVANATSRTYIVSVTGGTPRLVYESTPWVVGSYFISFLDWTADGRYLAIKDLRDGRSALYLLPIRDGLPDGEARFVRFGEYDEGMTTQSGALVSSDDLSQPASSDALLGGLDEGGRFQGWLKLKLKASKNSSFSFSPDGTAIAYTALDADATRRNLVIHNLETGQERVVYHSEYASLNCKFSSLHPRLFCVVEKEGAKSTLMSIEAESGHVEQIASFPASRFMLLPILDERTFYFSEKAWSLSELDPPILRWDRTTHEETVLVDSTKDRIHVCFSLDGRWIIRQSQDVMALRPIEGGEWRTVATGARGLQGATTTADGKWLLYLGEDASGRLSLFRVSVSGGSPELIAQIPAGHSVGSLTASPDGRHLLGGIDSGPVPTLWVLENYVPSEK